MIILLKVILSLILIATGFIFRFTSMDFMKVRKSDGYDNLSVWEKMRFSAVFYFILLSLISLFVFLGYFIVIPMQINV